MCLSSKHVHAAHTLSEAVQVLEVVAEEEAEGVPYLELLTAHPADGEEAEQTQKASSQPSLGGVKQQASVPNPDGAFSWCMSSQPCPIKACYAGACPSLALPC